MKRLAFIMMALAAVTAFAEIKQISVYGEGASYYQFTHDEPTNTGDYHDFTNAAQPWLAAQRIHLTIPSEADVWVSNYVNSWYGEIPALDGNVYQMGAEQYGAVQVNGDKTWVGSGETAIVTFKDALTGVENKTTAYFLGHFLGGEEVYVWMTTLESDGGERVTSEQLVHDASHDTTLASRVDGTHDLADNVRVNFGLTNEFPREFVMMGATDPSMPINGEPLPGVMATVFVAGGVYAASKKRKKK